MTGPPARKGPKRRNGDGGIWQRASDGRFAARAYPPPDSGLKPHTVYGQTWDEAKEKRDKAQAEMAEGVPPPGSQTVAEYLTWWMGTALPREVRKGDLAQSTLDSYRDNISKHVLSAGWVTADGRRVAGLGSTPLRRLSVNRVDQWMDDLLAKPSGRQRKKLRKGETELPPPVLLSPRTVIYCHAILRRALNDAVRAETITRNVMLKVQPPKDARPRKKHLLPKEGTRRLLAEAAGDRLWCYWLTVLSLGLRRGEGLAIRWDGIDFDAGTILLDGTIQRLRVTDPDSGVTRTALVRKAVKTDLSEATVPAGRHLLKALRRHQKEQAAERLRAAAWKDTGLVFTTQIGTALEPRNVMRAWEAICARAGVKATIHDLRHTFGGYLVSDGVHQRVIQGALRHARLDTTEIYMDVIDEAQRAAFDRMDLIVTELRPREPGRKALP